MKAATIGLVLALVTRTAAAQTEGPPPPNLAGEIRGGDKVILVTSEGTTVTGRVQAVTATTVSLDTSRGIETIPISRIGRVVVKDSIRNGLWIGLGAGASAGLAGGLMLNAICSNESGACPSAVVVLAALGAAAGAGIGAGMDGLRHRTVYDIMPDLAREYVPHVALNVAAGRSLTGGLGVNGPGSGGGAWGIRHLSGVGLELEGNRTLGRSTRLVSCANAPSTVASAAGCVGEGLEGIQDTTVASAKIQYFFPGRRAQPYLSGGLAMYQASVWRSSVIEPPFFSREPRLSETLSRRRGMAAVAGGGVRIALTRHASLRPDVTVYKADGWTYVRAGTGIAVGW